MFSSITGSHPQSTGGLVLAEDVLLYGPVNKAETIKGKRKREKSVKRKARRIRKTHWCSGYRRRNGHGATSSNPGRV